MEMQEEGEQCLAIHLFIHSSKQLPASLYDRNDEWNVGLAP